MPRCPVCDAAVDLVKTPTVPFCSDRCRTIDLGRWLGESYGLPRRPSSGAADDERDESGDGES
jgi:hypothetical protein